MNVRLFSYSDEFGAEEFEPYDNANELMDGARRLCASFLKHLKQDGIARKIIIEVGDWGEDSTIPEDPDNDPEETGIEE